MRFEEHLYAVADVNLQTEEIVFTTSDDKRMETFPEVVSNLSIAGVKPISGHQCWNLWHRQPATWFADFTQGETA